MSADNFIGIIKKGRNYTGYYCCASHSYPYVKCFECLGRQLFKVARLRQAIDLAQEENTEYGCWVYDWKEEVLETCPCRTRKFTDRLE